MNSEKKVREGHAAKFRLAMGAFGGRFTTHAAQQAYGSSGEVATHGVALGVDVTDGGGDGFRCAARKGSWHAGTIGGGFVQGEDVRGKQRPEGDEGVKRIV